ncbi:hypothetical protein C0993_008033 [Termitomyces sp. T159_Od127]|nr:hypothetical protein C0993_008033 [Termitomyces sp. T159_Od127]
MQIGHITESDNVPVFRSVKEAADRPYSYVFLASKAIPERATTPSVLKPLLSAPYADDYPQPTYVLLQNGLGVESDLYHAIKEIGKEPSIVSTALWINTNLLQPNVVEHGTVDRLIIGVYRHNDFTTVTNTAAEAALLEDLSAILTAGGTSVTIVPEVQRQKFSKNFWNVAFSSCATLTRYRLPALFRQPPSDPSKPYTPYVSPTTAHLIEEYTIPAIRATLEELVVLARALGYPDSIDGISSTLPGEVIENTRKLHVGPDSFHKPSMMIDAEKNQPLEVEVIFGVFAPGPATIDARLSDKSELALVASFKNIKLDRDEIPLRPDFGTKGKQVKLRANFFPVKIPKRPLYEYEVTISPTNKTAMRRVRRRIFQLAEESSDWARKGLQGNVAHDHSSKLIAAKKLNQPLTIKVPFYDEDEDGPKPNGPEYTLTIQYSRDIDTQGLFSYLEGQPQYRGYDILPVISALNVVLSSHPNRSGGSGVMVGRNRFFFPSEAAPASLGGGLEAWKGFYSSVRPSHNQLLVNVNVCTTAFYTPGNLARAMVEFQESSFGARANVFVKGVRIRTTHLNYKKTVKNLASFNARQHSFHTDEYGTVTVETYFKRKYQITLKKPDLPLVDVGGTKANYLPSELCEILPNQAFRGKLTDEQTASMITIAAKPPNINANAIVNRGLNELGFRQGAGSLGAFGISIGTEMAVVPGRILPPPGIKYGAGTPQVDDRASWNLRNVRFAKGATLSNWAVLLIRDGNDRDEFASTSDPELMRTMKGFADMCKNSGMNVNNAPPTVVQCQLPRKDRVDPSRAQAISAIRTTLRSLKTKPNLVLVLLSNSDKHVYSGLKHLCDSHLDLGQLQYFANVALKVNMKLGGVNHALDQNNMNWLMQRPTMLMGIDVTHPGPSSVKGTPSIAAVVASCDTSFAQYPASMEIQETKKEMVTNLEKMVRERITLFQKRSKTLPERILVYRDGVSEGQFQTVVAEELPAIRQACTKFDTAKAQFRPKITVVICVNLPNNYLTIVRLAHMTQQGKRHHTRFFPTEQENADKDGNPKAGTVVDRGVTSVYHFDFFLQAHGGLQGTTRPTHYYVVHDDIGFKADELQGLTNAVSYMFARATKAVSLVSPAYYADLACERGRCYLHRLLQGISSGGSTRSGSDAEEQVFREATQMWHGGVAGPALKDTMFYL